MRFVCVTFILCCYLACTPAGRGWAQTRGPAPFAKYFGNYQLSPDRILSGGPFFESEERLLLMEPIHLSAGALLALVGEDHFVSVSRTPPRIEVEFISEAGEVTALLWKESGKNPIRAPRVHRHTQQEVSFNNAGAVLRGTLFVPDQPGPHPGIVLVHGSGDSDRYGGPWNTFFLRFGFAVLAYDKRGVGESTGNWRSGSYKLLASDAAAAVQYLKSRPEIGDAPVGIHASSEGGWVAPLAASYSRGVAFLIIRAGPGQPPTPTALHERRNEFLAQGLRGDDLRSALGFWRALLQAADEGKRWEDLAPIIEPVKGESWYRKVYGEARPFKSRQAWEWTVKNAKIDPIESVRRLDIPILWFLAELDENVDTAASAPRLRAALEAAPTRDWDLRILPDANHAFFVEKPGKPRFTEGYWSVMAEWLQRRYTRSD